MYPHNFQYMKKKRSARPRAPVLSPTARKREIARLQAQLKTGKFTLQELMSIRGRIGGLSIKNIEGRRLGGRNGAAIRWAKA